MKKIFTGEEFYKFLKSYDYAFVCRSLKDFNGVFLRFATDRLTFNIARVGCRIDAQLAGDGWEAGGCTFVGKEFQCDVVDESDVETTVVVTSDKCTEGFTMALRKFS